MDLLPVSAPLVLGAVTAIVAAGGVALAARGWLQGRRARLRRAAEAQAAASRVASLPTTLPRPPEVPRSRAVRAVDANVDSPAVLLVDDRIEQLRMHAVYLGEHGYHVLTADNGDAAIEYARTHHPAVIVLDWSMPERSGAEVARELKADAATADIPILLMTAHSYGSVGAAARAVGCEGFLSKPVALSTLLREVDARVRPRETQA